MAEPNGDVDRIESAANITLTVTQGQSSGGGEAKMLEVPISRLDTTKEVEINQVREGQVKATGYSVTSISYSGTMMFKGSKKTKEAVSGEQVNLDNLLYDEQGVPVPVTIQITHDLNGEPEEYQTVLANSESYEVRSEETTETAYDWVAMDRASDQPQ